MNNKLTYDMIEKAVNGEANAITHVLNHYTGYITSLSMIPVKDERGRSFLIVDEQMKKHLEVKLITEILNFNLA